MKRVRIIILPVVCAAAIFWLGSVALCEYNTYRYEEVFRNIDVHDIDGNRYFKNEKIKILKYNGNYAKVYAVFKDDSNEYGSIYSFKNADGRWYFETYDTIWSKVGSADRFVWPYIR